MRKLHILSFSAAVLLAACGNQDKAPSGSEHAEETPVTTTADFLGKEPMDSMDLSSPKSFGPAKVNETVAIPVADLPAKIASADSMTNMTVRGKISACCQNKGCWMTMALADGQEMRVRFRGYGFFVPKNAAGNEVIVTGTAYREIISVEDQQHYAKDDGQSEAEIAAITQPKEELTFMADGALILPAGH